MQGTTDLSESGEQKLCSSVTQVQAKLLIDQRIVFK